MLGLTSACLMLGLLLEIHCLMLGLTSAREILFNVRPYFCLFNVRPYSCLFNVRPYFCLRDIVYC